MAGVIIVTTPQNVSLQDSRRGLAMFKQMNIPILGVIENMTCFIPPDQPQKSYEIFGSGGGKQLAEENNVSLAAHPNDPPLPVMRKTGRILKNPSEYEKLKEKIGSKEKHDKPAYKDFVKKACKK